MQGDLLDATGARLLTAVSSRYLRHSKLDNLVDWKVFVGSPIARSAEMSRNRFTCKNASVVGIIFCSVLVVDEAASADRFYMDKTIDLIVGAPPGGGYDSYARVVSRYMPRHVPGNPKFIVRYMPGAGSAIAARHVFNVAPKDGLTIVALMPGAVLGNLIDDKSVDLFDPTKFIYLGTAASEVRLCLTHATSDLKKYEDSLTRTATFGASGTGGGSRDYAAVHTHISGSRFKVITGYKGTSEVFLAMERGELDGVCGMSMSAIVSTRPDWVREGKVNLLIQDSISADPELTRLGVPHIMSFIKSVEDRKAVQLIFSQSSFNRPYAVAPGTPPEHAETLRDAFMSTLADKELLSEAIKLNIDVNPKSGKEVQELVQEIHTSSPEVIRRAREIVVPKAF